MLGSVSVYEYVWPFLCGSFTLQLFKELSVEQNKAFYEEDDQ